MTAGGLFIVSVTCLATFLLGYLLGAYVGHKERDYNDNWWC